MRPILLLLGLSVSTLAFAACTASSNEAGHNEELVRPSSPNADIIGPGGLALNIWTCKGLECLNLETSETSTQTYTACAAIMEDAQNVGINLCESRAAKRNNTILSQLAVCEPTGQPCPDQRRGAYNWDEEVSKRSDAGTDATTTAPTADGGS